MLESEICLLYDKFLIDQAKSPLLNWLLPSLFAQDSWISASFLIAFLLENKNELGQYPAILTSRLIDNAYIFHTSE